MHAATRDEEGPDFDAFLRHRGRDVLRFTYLLTGDAGSARVLALWSLAELGARWRPLVREHGDPEVAVRVLATSRYLHQPGAPPEPAPVPPAPEPAGPVPAKAAGPVPSGRFPALPLPAWYDADPAPVDTAPEGGAGWEELRARSPADRADLVLRHWAELDVAALDSALRPHRTSLLSALRTASPRAQLRATLRRLAEPPTGDDRALIDAAPRSNGPDRSGPLSGWFLQQVFRFGERYAPELEPDFLATVEAQATTRRRRYQRQRRLVSAGIAAVVVTALGAGALVSEPPPSPPQAAGGGASAALSWSEAWPGSRVTRFVAELQDGRAYRPLRFLDLRTALATTIDGSGTSELIIVDVLSRTARSLGNVGWPVDDVTIATDGFHVGWLARDTTNRAIGGRLWVADISGGRPRMLAEMPAAQLREHEPMLGMGAGRLYVIRTRGTENRAVDISSIRLTGGKLEHELSLPGFLPVGWPWFSTLATSSKQDVQVRNVLTGVEREGRLPSGSSLGACEGQWCMGVLQPSRRGPAGEVLLGRLDGSRRTQAVLSHPDSGPPLPVIAGRFVLTEGPDGVTFLRDLRENQQVRMSGTVRQVVPSGVLLGWSVGTSRGVRWRIADLTHLA